MGPDKPGSHSGELPGEESPNIKGQDSLRNQGRLLADGECHRKNTVPPWRDKGEKVR